MTSARIVLDSRHPLTGFARVTTMEVTMHRFVLAEFNTHRIFSRNAASSRAIPAKKMLARVAADPAMPISYPREQKGMQGGDELAGDNRTRAIAVIDRMRAFTIDGVAELVELGLHKSVANRYLEPWGWVTDIVTSTEWENVFVQRCHEAAQPEIRAAAEAIMVALAESTPQILAEDGWHLPYVTGYDWPEMVDAYGETDALWLAKQVSAARCARVSYLTHDGARDWRADVELYEKLVSATPAHRSPLEHICRPAMPWETQKGNLQGWRQFRHMVMDRNAYDRATVAR